MKAQIQEKPLNQTDTELCLNVKHRLIIDKYPHVFLSIQLKCSGLHQVVKQNKKNKHDFRMQEIVQQTTYCNENEEMLPVNCTRNLLLMDVNSRQCQNANKTLAHAPYFKLRLEAVLPFKTILIHLQWTCMKCFQLALSMTGIPIGNSCNAHQQLPRDKGSTKNFKGRHLVAQ